MSPRDIVLPKFNPDLPHRAIFKLEYVMDPPPFILDRLEDKVVLEIYKTNMHYAMELMKMEQKLIRMDMERMEKVSNLIR